MGEKFYYGGGEINKDTRMGRGRNEAPLDSSGMLWLLTVGMQRSTSGAVIQPGLRVSW